MLLVPAVLAATVAAGCSSSGPSPAPGASSSSAAATPAWAAALSGQERRFEELTSEGDEVMVSLVFGAPSGEPSAVRVPVTVGYEGNERTDSWKVRALGKDNVDREVRVDGEAQLPLPKTKRELTLVIPNNEPDVLALQAGQLTVGLKRDGAGWKTVETPGVVKLKKFRQVRDLARAACDGLSAKACDGPRLGQSDRSVSFDSDTWSIRVCPRVNCFDRCKNVIANHGKIGGKGELWSKKSAQVCAVKLSDGAPSAEQEKRVEDVIAASRD